MSNVIVHKSFEMGTAPYRFIGIYSTPSTSLAETNPNAYNAALAGMPACCHSMCDHCGTPITHHFILRDATGNKFAVGSECIKKVDDILNMSEVEYQKRQRGKDDRKAKADAKREKQNLAREAKWVAEREANGGLTDFEVIEAKREAELVLEREGYKVKFAYFINQLDDFGFAGDLMRGMRDNGTLPYGRGQDIMLSMIAKKAGRANSKAYEAKYAEAELKLEEVK